MKSSSKYLNRDLSWIEFNRRVLEEAKDENTPLLERVKFLSIVSSNFDEFVSVRIAGIQDQIKAGYEKKDFSGYTPSELQSKLIKKAKKMVNEQYIAYRQLMRQLRKEHLMFTAYDDLNANQKKAMDTYFFDIIFPVLTPMAVDNSRPFPHVHSKHLYLSITLEEQAGSENELYFSILEVPAILPRLVPVPARHNSRKKEFILLENLVKQHVESLFKGYSLVAIKAFRLTRNSDLTIDEEGAEDLLEEIQKELHRRQWGEAVRLEVEQGFHPEALNMLCAEFDMDADEHNVFTIDGVIDLTFLMDFSLSLNGFDHLKHPVIEPVYPQEFAGQEDLFSVIRKQDVLVYHPYESFKAIDDFIVQAAHDPDVLAIKITLYRVSGNSLIVQSLAHAAESGKQVTVVVELKARFDEERNIAWARTLEKAGCHVVYGLVGLKIHAKMLLVVRKENRKLQGYVHISTGNYNGQTAKLYMDVGLFTSNPSVRQDASVFFNEITGYSSPHDWNILGVGPIELKKKLFALIDHEIACAKSGKKARIIAKVNSLSNKEIIDRLYEASQAGVQVELNVRGICSLRPGVLGLSENIQVISIVDRYLEHTRLFYFENAGDENIWISSADWMTRNLDRRIELMCPVKDPETKSLLLQILMLSMNDNVKARLLLPNGQYVRVKNDLPPLRSQFEAHGVTVWKEVAAARADTSLE